MMKFFQIFAFSIILLCNKCFCDDNFVIFINGISCSGKSTISLELLKKYPGKFKILKKTTLVENLRYDLMEEITGCRPLDNQEYTEMYVKLTPEEKNHFKKIDQKAIMITLDILKKTIENGESVIFDSCVIGFDLQEELKSIPTVSILIYAPLNELIKRAEKRAEIYGRSELVKQRAKNTILSSFLMLYRPVVDEAESIDFIQKDEVYDLFFVPLSELLYPSLRISLENFYRYFVNQEFSYIQPVKQHDLFINTKKHSIEECVEKIVHYLDGAASLQSQNS